METKDSTKPHKLKSSKTSLFSSCFGSDGNVSDSDMKKDLSDRIGIGNSNNKKKKKKKRKISALFSCFNFRTRKSASKTVPVDSPDAEKLRREAGRFAEIISESVDGVPEKVGGKRQAQGPSGRGDGGEVAITTKPDYAFVEKHHKAKHGNDKLQRVESHPQISTAQSKNSIESCETCPNSKGRKAQSGPSSPNLIPTRSLTVSSAFPPPRAQKALYVAATSRHNIRKSDCEDDLVTEKWNPMIGMSILIVMIVVLLIWGRVWAVICTSAWFYLIPKLRKTFAFGEFTDKSTESGRFDMKSCENKNKVNQQYTLAISL